MEKRKHVPSPNGSLKKKRFANAPYSSSSSAFHQNNLDPRIAEQRKLLPIHSGKEAIITSVRSHDTVIILGETGSGKTTQIPQYLFEAGLSGTKMIGITQPRRVAATSLARRVAVETGSPDPNCKHVGLVGYSIRFEDRTSKRTRIKFMTDGMVLREMIGNDGLLSRYSVLLIDEAHERTLRTDMVLGLAKRIQRERKILRRDWINRGHPSDEAEPTLLKLLVMSATLDAQSFADFFAAPSKAISSDKTMLRVPILYVKGRQHAVTMFHTEEATTEWADAALRTILQIHVSRPPGDILVFMTGQEEIESLAKSLQAYSQELPTWAKEEGKALPLKLSVAPLYAALGPSALTKVFATTPPQTRKVVLATNIAETSITIPGIVYVIDCGLAKEKIYTPNTCVESLQTTIISQSAARQRAGRAGRERSGECYRLYTSSSFREMAKVAVPEIQRTDLGGAVLALCAVGQDPYAFDWLDPPDALALRDAVIHLIQLEAVKVKEAKLSLTALGKKMALLPVAPAYARALLAATKRGAKATRQVRDLIAILSADRSILLDPADPDKRDEANKAKLAFVHPSGDHATLLNILYAYLGEEDGKAWCANHWVHERAMRNVLHIRKQLGRICKQHGIDCEDDDELDFNTDSEEEGDGLYTTRVGKRQIGQEEDYVHLRLCLLEGRFNNAALRTPEGTWKRSGGGGPPFKLHPSSVLHSQPKPACLLFEELVLTSQTFARTCSRIDPSWLLTHHP